MIPTMIVFGLLFGRWWRAALVAAAVVWPVLLVSTGVYERSWRVGWQLVGAALLGAVNAGVGVAVHQGVLAGVRWLRRRHRAARSSQ